jgi:hypothetical protein
MFEADDIYTTHTYKLRQSRQEWLPYYISMYPRGSALTGGPFFSR